MGAILRGRWWSVEEKKESSEFSTKIGWKSPLCSFQKRGEGVVESKQRVGVV